MFTLFFRNKYETGAAYRSGGDTACRIEGDFEFLPAPVGLDIQDWVDEIAGCSGFV